MEDAVPFSDGFSDGFAKDNSSQSSVTPLFVAAPMAQTSGVVMASMTLNPATTITTGTNPINVVATGTGTSWTTTTQFEVFGGNVATIGDVIVNVVAQTATIQLYPGGASATLTITEVTNNTSATVTVTSTTETIAPNMISAVMLNSTVQLGEPAECKIVAPPGTYTVTSSAGDVIPSFTIMAGKVGTIFRWTPSASGTLTFSGGIPACAYQVQGLGFHPQGR